MKMIREGIFLSVLLWCSGKDICKKEIEPVTVIIGILYGFFDRFILQKTDPGQILICCLPGFCFLALSFISDRDIGFGDGLVICMGGLYYPLRTVLYWLFYAFTLSAFWGGLLIIQKKAGRRTELAFVPFLLLSALIIYFLKEGVTGGK